MVLLELFERVFEMTELLLLEDVLSLIS